VGSAVGLAVDPDAEGDRVEAYVTVPAPVSDDVRVMVLVGDRAGDPDTDSPVDLVIEPNRDPLADPLTDWLLVVEALTDVDWLGLVVSVGVATPVSDDVRVMVLVGDRAGDPDTDSPVDLVIEPNRDPDADPLTDWLLVVEPHTDVD